MTVRMKPVAATLSACVVTLAFSGPVIGGDDWRYGIPKSGGHIEDWYFAKSQSLERSDMAAFDTKSIRSGNPQSTRPEVTSGLPKSGGHIEDWYFTAPTTLR